MESLKPSGNSFNYIDIDAIDNKAQRIKEPKNILTKNAPSRASRKVYSTSTLFSMVRPYLKNIAYVGDKYKDCIASTGFYVCTPMPFVNEKYLYLLLTSNYIVNKLNFFMKGDNSPSINGNNLEDLYFPIPSLKYQEKVVSIINNILPLLEKIIIEKSTLETFISKVKNKLLDYYFGENSSYKSYYENEEGNLINYCSSITKGSTPTTYGYKYLSSGIPFIKVENVSNNEICQNSITCYISKEAHEFQKRSQLKENDILFSIAGTIGKICLIKEENIPANTNQAFAIISGYFDKIIPKYLFYYLEWSKHSNQKVDSHGGGMMNATLDGIKKLNIWFPKDKANQLKIVTKIENMEYYISKIKEQII